MVFLVRARAWLWFLCAGLAVSLGAALSGSNLVIAIATQTMGWMAAILGLASVRQGPREMRRPWVFFASAAVAFLLAGAVRAVHGLIVDQDRPFPSPADLIALTGHLMLIIGSTLLGHLRAPGPGPGRHHRRRHHRRSASRPWSGPGCSGRT